MMIFQIGVLLLSFLFVGTVQAQEATQMNMEILKEKVKADKKLLVATNMNLNDAEAKNFWPLYDGYQKELEQINQRLGKTINAYAEAFNAGKGEISNDQAKKIMGEALAVEESEVTLRKSYYEKLGKAFACHESRPLSPDRKQNSSPGEVRTGLVDSSRELIDQRPRLAREAHEPHVQTGTARKMKIRPNEVIESSSRLWE